MTKISRRTSFAMLGAPFAGAVAVRADQGDTAERQPQDDPASPFSGPDLDYA